MRVGEQSVGVAKGTKDTELFTTYCRYAFHSQPKKKSSVTLTATVVRRTQHQTKSQDYCRFIRFLSCVTAPPIDPFHVFTFHSSRSFHPPATLRSAGPEGAGVSRETRHGTEGTKGVRERRTERG